MGAKHLIRRVASGVMAGIMLVSTLAVVPFKEASAATTPKKQDASSAVNYATILGRATDFGIVANRFTHNNHMETTYAINYLSQVNDNVSDVDFITGTAQFIVGHLEVGQIALGAKQTANTYNMEIAEDVVGNFTYPWLDENENEHYTGKFENFRIDYNFHDAEDQELLVYPVATSTASANIAKIIENADDKGADINTKATSSDYAIDPDDYRVKDANGNPTDTAHFVLDLDNGEFENKVVYINVTKDSVIKNFLASSEGIQILKNSSTVVVFNIVSDIKEVKLNKIAVSVDGGTKWIKSTTASSGGTDAGGYTNDEVDAEICQKVIWNVNADDANVELDNNAGTFLIPGANTTVDVVGSSAGWVVAGGESINHAEWHYIYKGGSQETMTDEEGEIHFAARKSFTEEWAGKDTQEDTSVYSEAGDYSFNWYETDSSYSTSGVTPEVAATQATNTIKFPTLHFYTDAAHSSNKYYVEKDKSKTFYYLVKEVNAGTTKDGVEISEGRIEIKLVVENDDGRLKFTVSTTTYLGDGSVYKENKDVDMSGVEFTMGAFFNLLKTDETPTPTPKTTGEAEAEISLTKNVVNELTGGAALSKEGFEFTLTGTSDNNKDEVIKAVSDADGKVKFSKKFTEAGTYEYVLEETNGTKAGFTYSTKKYYVTIVVTASNYQINPEAQVTIKNESGSTVSSGIVFTNTYTAASVEAEISAKKVLTDVDGKEMELADGRFGFTFSIDDDSNTVVSTARNLADGSVTFKMKYEKPGVYKYVIKEKNEGEDGVTYDTKEYPVTVTVTDDGEGHLVAEVSGSAEDRVFTNIYEQDQEKTYFELNAKKALAGDWTTEKDLKAGDYSFVLTFEGESYNAVNTADGSIKFTDIPCPEVDGVYSFTISEVIPTPAVKGMTYADPVEGKVTVVDGVATVTAPTGDIVFTNTYSYEPSRHELELSKVIAKVDGETLEGAVIKFTRNDGNFDFRDDRVKVTQGSKTAKDLKQEASFISFTTVAENITVITGIPSGDYTMTEVSAPEGYKIAEPIVISVSEEGDVTVQGGAMSGATVVMIDDPYPVTPTPTLSPTPTVSANVTGTPTPTVSANVTGTPTPTVSANVTNTPTPTPRAGTTNTPTPTPEGGSSNLTPTPGGGDSGNVTPTPTPEGGGNGGITPTPGGGSNGGVTPTPTPSGSRRSVPTPTPSGGRNSLTRGELDQSPRTGESHAAGLFAAAGLLSMAALAVVTVIDKKRG